MKRRLVILPGLVGLLAASTLSASGQDVTGAVKALKSWPDEKAFVPAHAQDHVVVFDFFAHWCIPCRQASKDVVALEQKYHGRGAPPRVSFVAVNVEKLQPALTKRFMEQTGLHKAYHDTGGGLGEALGVHGLPFICIARAESVSGTLRYKVAKSFAAYPGSAALEREIETVRRSMAPRSQAPGSPPAAPTTPSATKPASPAPAKSPTPPTAVTDPVPPATSVTEGGSGSGDSEVIDADSAPHLNTVPPDLTGEATTGIDTDWSLEYLGSSDVSILAGTLTLEREWDSCSLSLDLGHTYFGVDYRPSARSLVGRPADLDAHQNQFGINGEYELGIDSSLLVGASYYDGFTDYRSVWLDGFYRQQFAAFPGYDAGTDPRGWSINAGGRYEYIPGNAVAELTVGYQVDHISPAYERDFTGPDPLLQGRSRLTTTSINLSSENLVNSRMRARHQLQLTDTTDRHWRMAYTGTLHTAVTEKLVAKVHAAATHEPSTFDSWSLGTTLEYDLNDCLILSLFARYYEDEGEIIDPTILSSAAPALRTTRLGIGLRYRKEAFEAWIAGGFYQTDYSTLPAQSFQYENLYNDRNWGFLQCAISLEF